MITPNSPDVISRIGEEIDAKYPVKKDLAERAGLTQPQVTRIATNGKYSAETRKKLVAAGLDMDYVETGVRKNDSPAIVKEPQPEYDTEQKPFFRVVFEDVPEGVTIKQKQTGGCLEIELYRGNAVSA